MKVSYRYYEGVRDVQEYIDHLDRRLVGADPLIRVTFPGKIDYYDDRDTGDIKTTLKVKMFDGVTKIEVEDAIREFTENLSTVFEVSDLIAYLYEMRLVDYIQQPMYLRLTIVGEDRDETIFKPTDVQGEKFLSSFDLVELDKKNVGFVSEILVEEIK